MNKISKNHEGWIRRYTSPITLLSPRSIAPNNNDNKLPSCCRSPYSHITAF